MKTEINFILLSKILNYKPTITYYDGNDIILS